jgi:exopolyphosphatase/guanosine-5'-triphosphate,3'-diphosphate pyrophosphatase
MILSVIDIGTNTILMVTVEIVGGTIVRVLGDEHAIARLGSGVDASRTILPETFDRVEGFLRRYRAIAEDLGAARIVAFGTSALRDARNRDAFVAAMRERTGIAIELLSGNDEAVWTYRGALFGLGLDARRSAVLDIGGGSTELAFGDGERVERATSVDIGAVRLTERFFPSLPPSSDALAAARAWAGETAAELFGLPAPTALVGVAGTVTTLGAIARGLERFDAQELNGTPLALATIEEIASHLATLTHEQTRAIPQIASGRADIILAGTTILVAVMRRLGIETIVVSTRGVRYGIALREARREAPH